VGTVEHGADVDVEIRPLRAGSAAAATLALWFQREWPDHFRGMSPAEIEAAHLSSGADGGLPVILAAYSHGALCGTIALREHDLTTHPHLSPWVGGLLVSPSHRRRGVGRALIVAGTDEAARRGWTSLYAGTANAAGLLRSLGWQAMEDLHYHGTPITLFRKVWLAASEV